MVFIGKASNFSGGQVVLVALTVAAACIALSQVAFSQQAKSRIGPSYDCGQIDARQNPTAAIICRNDELARSEIIYVQTYYALRGIVDQAIRRSLADEALKFSDEQQRICGIRADALTEQPNNTQVDCIRGSFQKQTQLLRGRLAGDALKEAALPPEALFVMQEFLKLKSFLPGEATVDGIFGPATRNAVKQFQASVSLPQTGFLSKETVDMAGVEIERQLADKKNEILEQTKQPTQEFTDKKSQSATNPTTTELIRKWNEINSKCRGGSGDAPDTWKACDERNKLTNEITRLGYTYGCDGDAGYQSYWRNDCGSLGNKFPSTDWNRYCNARFGQCADYPSNLKLDPPPANNDGIVVRDGTDLHIIISGRHNVLSQTLQAEFTETTKSYEVVKTTRLGSNWFEMSATNGTTAIFIKKYVNRDTILTLYIAHPVQLAEKYTLLSERVVRSFTPSKQQFVDRKDQDNASLEAARKRTAEIEVTTRKETIGGLEGRYRAREKTILEKVLNYTTTANEEGIAANSMLRFGRAGFAMHGPIFWISGLDGDHECVLTEIDSRMKKDKFDVRAISERGFTIEKDFVVKLDHTTSIWKWRIGDERIVLTPFDNGQVPQRLARAWELAFNKCPPRKSAF